jgi:hypothetical protein
MITETDVPVIVKRLAEAKYPDYYQVLSGDLMHAMAAAMQVEFANTCLIVGTVALALLTSGPDTGRRFQPSLDDAELKGMPGHYGGDCIQVISDNHMPVDERPLHRDLMCLAVVRNGTIIDYRAALVY